MTNMNIVEFVGNQAELFAGTLSVDVKEEITWAKEQQFAIQAFQKNDYLAKVAMNNPASAQNAIINIASVGISLNPALKHAYLVPREGGVCLDISYMGLMHLAQMSGVIRWGQAKIVYANDTYQNNGLDVAPSHKFNTFGDRGDPIGVYCTVKTADGDYLTEEMSKEQVYSIRSRSAGFSSGKKTPWKTDELEMWRKTCVKRAYKYWPKCERLATAIDVINQGGEGLDNLNQAALVEDCEATEETLTKLNNLLIERDVDIQAFTAWISKQVGRDINGTIQLSELEALRCIKNMENSKQ